MATRRISEAEARRARGATDWKKVKAMTDSEVSASAKSDPDARELALHELATFKRLRDTKVKR
jgi:hypothetical protein